MKLPIDPFALRAKSKHVMLRNKKFRSLITAIFLLGGCIPSAFAWGLFDPLNSEGKLAELQRQSTNLDVLTRSNCEFSPPKQPLALIEAAERALCLNPKARQALVNTKFQTTQVGLARTAYMPTLTTTATHSSTTSDSYLAGTPFQVSGSTATSSRTISLSFLLFDFGKREYNAINANEALLATLSTQDATIQSVLLATAQAYFDAIAARAVRDAVLDAEHMAEQSYLMSNSRAENGVGTITDKYQAKAAWSQAIFNRKKAEGELRNALGSFAIQIGLNANYPLELPAIDEANPSSDFDQNLEELMAKAKHQHPNLLAAQAQLRAAEAKVKTTIAEGLPTISFGVSKTATSQSPIYSGQTITPDYRSVGVTANFPLFEGFSRLYQTKAAMAQVELQEINLQSVEQQVELAVWQSYQDLKTQTEGLTASEDVLRSAKDSLQKTQGRYGAGVGNISDLLNAQTTLTNATQQRLQTITSWHTTRLKLAASLGELRLELTE